MKLLGLYVTQLLIGWAWLAYRKFKNEKETGHE